MDSTEPPPEPSAPDYSDAFSLIDNIPGQYAQADAAARDAGTRMPDGRSPSDPVPPVPPKGARPAEPAAPAEPPKPAAEPAAPAEPGAGDDDLMSGLPGGATKPAAEPAEPAKPTSTIPEAGSYKTPKELRTAYEDLRKRYSDLETRATTKPPAEEIEKLSAPLKQRITELEKVTEELETELRYENFTKSREYKEKYEKPLTEAYKAAVEELVGAEIADGRGGARQATEADIRQILAAPTLAEASKLAVQVFGQVLAPYVLGHRKTMGELIMAKKNAIEGWRKNGSELAAQREAQEKQIFESTVKQWSALLEEHAAKRPDLFAPDEKDPDGNKLLEEGDRIVRLAMLGEGVKDGLSDEERRSVLVKARATVSARAKAYGREVLRNQRLSEEVSKLKARIAELEGSEPVPGGGNPSPAPGTTGGAGQPQPNSWEAEIDALPGFR